MESAQAKVNYIVHTQVVKVEEKFETVHVSGFGAETKTEKHSLGWYIYLRGSYEAIYLGENRPAFAHGDKVKITFERIDDAKPVAAPK